MAEIIIGATRHYGGDAWFRELTVGGVTFLAPLDDQDKARYVLATLAPEASGADYVVVPREPTPEVLEAGRVFSPSCWANGADFDLTDVARLWMAMVKAVNPAPPTSGPADESGALNALADDEAERQQYERDKLDPSNCLTTPTAEPRAAAQEGAPSIAQIGAEAWHLAADLDDLAANGIATAGRAADFIRARLQPSGAGEDAARYREIAHRWQHQKTSESELFLMTLRIEGDPTGHLDDIIDAARRARGESNGRA